MLAFHLRCADIFWIGMPAHNLHVRPDACCWTITALLGIGRSAVYLLELRIVHVHSKRTFNGFQVGFVAVCSELEVSLDAVGAILHKLVSPAAITSANQIR